MWFNLSSLLFSAVLRGDALAACAKTLGFIRPRRLVLEGPRGNLRSEPVAHFMKNSAIVCLIFTRPQLWVSCPLKGKIKIYDS